ncbi:hypothetical protein, partial [Actinotignum sp. GS-2025b]|uniref:hypothetical protein n=1 Tax=Actinotignum sp. GS-2025b TaxID=3427275 RepID=UPI003F4473C6
MGSEGIDVLVVESGILRVEISYAGKTGWALAHNQVPVIKNILATNRGCGLFIGHYRLKPLDDAPQSLNHRT